MANENTQLQTKTTAKAIDVAVNELITQSKEMGAFERALKKSEIIAMISDALDASGQMGAVMKMQGKQFGFRTDSQVPEGYPQETVKNCLIEATLRGVEPTGNMFNILGGNCYITKEGCKHILNRMGIPYKIQSALSKMLDNNICVVPMNLIWFDKTGKENKKYLEIPVTLKKNKEGGIVTKEEARKGMAERDALAWLIEDLTGTPMPIGEVVNETVDTIGHEVKGNVVDSEPEKPHATPEQQTKFDSYISKSTELSRLDVRAKACADQLNVIFTDYYDLTVYNELRIKLTNPAQ